MVKLLLKLIWFGFGAFGLVVIGQKYWPGANPADLIRGAQGSLVSDKSEAGDRGEKLTINDLKNLDPQTASQVLGETIKVEVTKILETVTEEVTTFPAKQVRKIKIGACEELLEEDICSVAKEIQCQ